MPAIEVTIPQTETLKDSALSGNPPQPQAVKPPSRPKSPRRKWLAAVAALLIATTSVVLYSRRTGAVEYVPAPVDRGDIVAGITATGNTNAVKTVQVGSQVSGNILALYADFNTKVKAGQLVAKIDPAIFQAKVDQARAALDSAKESVVSARASIAKAQSDIAGAQASVASQKANTVHAQSAVTDAKT